MPVMKGKESKRMKKRIIALGLLLLITLTFVLSCGKDNKDAGASALSGIEEQDVSPLGARAELDPVTRLVFTFTVEKESYNSAVENGAELRGFWAEHNPDEPLNQDNGILGSVTVLGESMTDGVRYYTLGVMTGRIAACDYIKKYSAILEVIPRTSEEDTLTFASKPYDLYSVCLAEYNVRSDRYTPYYCYEMPDGSYSPYSDAGKRADVLSSYLFLTLEGGEARDSHSGEYYVTPYSIEYLDRVLTISLPYSEIREEMFYGLFVNGEAVYYEIYKGKISLVVTE